MSRRYFVVKTCRCSIHNFGASLRRYQSPSQSQVAIPVLKALWCAGDFLHRAAFSHLWMFCFWIISEFVLTVWVLFHNEYFVNIFCVLDLYRYDVQSNALLGPTSLVVPFVACGDLSGFDPDKSYPLNLSDSDSYTYHAPVQPPIHPNYYTYQQRHPKGVQT